jgi:RNA polymerase sigma-70 factor, ECF subfamily
MLDTLSPVERAVFLLREVFDYDYAEVAAVVGKSEANCRQIVRRAKQQLHPDSGREAQSKPHHPQAERVVQRFMEATATGEIGELLALLTEDATLYSDGGGRVAAAGRPIETADQVSRFFIGIRSKRPPGTKVTFTHINGRPGVLMTVGGEVHNAVSFDLEGDRVHNIYVVRNPDKLRHLAHLHPSLSNPNESNTDRESTSVQSPS